MSTGGRSGRRKALGAFVFCIALALVAGCASAGPGPRSELRPRATTRRCWTPAPIPPSPAGTAGDLQLGRQLEARRLGDHVVVPLQDNDGLSAAVLLYPTSADAIRPTSPSSPHSESHLFISGCGRLRISHGDNDSDPRARRSGNSEGPKCGIRRPARYTASQDHSVRRRRQATTAQFSSVKGDRQVRMARTLAKHRGLLHTCRKGRARNRAR